MTHFTLQLVTSHKELLRSVRCTYTQDGPQTSSGASRSAAVPADTEHLDLLTGQRTLLKQNIFFGCRTALLTLTQKDR